jgi:hypothetical protein
VSFTDEQLAEFQFVQRKMAEFDASVAECGDVICPRCKRKAVGWPLKRADVCSPKDWADCLRHPSVILNRQAKEAKLAAERQP